MTIAARIQTFNAVRDLPYYIATHGEDDCCCSTKSFILQRRLASLGIGSVMAFGTFLWSSILPDSVRAALPSDEAWHQWLRVFVPETNEWIDLDPSWDIQLAKHFPIAEWDGRSSTRLGVPLTKRCSDEENKDILAAGYQPTAVASYMNEHREFLKTLNEYLQLIRA